MSLTSPVNTPYFMTNTILGRFGLRAKANTTLWSGGFVAMDPTGTVIPAASNRAGLGFLRAGADFFSNADPTLYPELQIDFNMSVHLYIPNATLASVGTAKCYATADDTFTVTPNTCIVGDIIDVVDAANDIYEVFVTCK